MLVGVLGVSALAAAIVLGMRGVERGLARLLGLPQFRWFEVQTGPGWAWKRLVVRVGSALVPFALSAAIFTFGYAVGGAVEPTTAVTVLPGGAAQEAGMESGDRVLAVGNVPVDTWEEARSQIQTHADPVLITIARSGQKRELKVAPRDRRIGVAPISEMRPIGMGDAAWRGMGLPLSVVGGAARSFIRWHSVDTVDLRGPVGIVKDTGEAAKAGWRSLLFLAMLGSYVWPFVAAMHVFDSVTGWMFRRTLTETDLPEPTLRVARLRFSLQFSLGCWLAFLLAEAAATAGVPGTLLLVALLMPGVWTLWPLLWVSARELWSKKSSWGLVPVALIPCGAPLVGISVALALRKEERRLRAHVQPTAA